MIDNLQKEQIRIINKRSQLRKENKKIKNKMWSGCGLWSPEYKRLKKQSEAIEKELLELNKTANQAIYNFLGGE